MFKTHIFAGVVTLAAATLLTGCHSDDSPFSSRKGGLTPNIQLDTKVTSSEKVAARSGSDVTVNDLALTISSTNGSFSQTWNTVSDYPADQQFSIGEYLVEAKYGDPSVEGFECPAYYGSQTVTVRENEDTPVSLTATLANAMVSIVYTDAFKRYMSEWDANLHSAGGQYVYFAQNETRPGYLSAGAVTMNVWFKKPNGQDATMKVVEFNAQARHHYHITVDLNNGDGGGTAQLVISFDDTLAQEDVVIDLSDELFSAPAPTIAGNGCENGSAFTYVIGDVWSQPLKTEIVAQGGIQSVVLTTQSASLVGQGWPSEVDLVKADGVMQARLKQLGFDCRGLWNTEVGKYAVLDFSNVLASLTENENASNVFTVNVTDVMNKTSEPFAFSITTTPLNISIENASTLAVGYTEFSFDMIYNGNNVDGITYQTYNDRGTWTALTAIGVEPTADATKYRVTVKAPADNKALRIRAVYKTTVSNELDVNRTSPDITLSVNENDVWANKAILSLSCDEVDPNLLASAATLYLSENGGEYTAVVSTVKDNKITANGLKAATSYKAKVSVTGNVNETSNEVSFTTETASVVPNGDFETLTQTRSESKLLQGGKWSISAGINYDSYAQYTVNEPVNWSSVNKKTTAGSTRNTWFVVPSTFNTTLSYSSTVPNIKVLGIGGGTETPSAYKGFSAHSGSNAMVVRNVGYDLAGTRPSVWRKEFAGKDEYYNHNVPTVSQKAIGKLFLGSYSFSNGSETYDEGILFGSRPAKLTGWYTYTRDGQDASESGTVKVELLNGNTVIGSGTATLGAAGSFSQFTVSVNYVDNAPKATSLRIMITSSDRNESSVKLTSYNSRYEGYYHGATLVVDNLQFVY